MITMLDADPNTLDERDRKFVDNVREHGWFNNGVMGEGDFPGFSYTTGFWLSAKMPEVIIFSTKNKIAHNLFWDMFRQGKVGEKYPVGQRTNQLFANLPACLFPVARKYYPKYLGFSRWFYGGDEFPCLQLVWPDREGLFPWEQGFDESFRRDQPDLTEHGWRNSLAN